MRRLRQCIELTGIHPAGYHKVSCAFGRAFDQEGGFDIHKSVVVQIVSGCPVHFVPQCKILFNRIPPQVKKTVFHSDIIASVGIVLYGKGGRNRPVQDPELGNKYFYIAGGDIGVLITSFIDPALYLQNVFSSKRVGFQVGVQ